jgi:REP element-mobilizing transposase RayT
MPCIRVWLHLVWSTKNREPVLSRELRTAVFGHIVLQAEQKNICLDTIGGYLEHVHALISLGSDQTIAKIAQLLKGESSHWLNKSGLLQGRFEWQEEYFAVSVGESSVQTVRKYIQSQEEHHRRRSFAEEYNEFLGMHGLAEGAGGNIPA